MGATTQQRTVEGRASVPAAALRLTPLTGVVSALLLIAGIVVLEGVADRPEESAPAGVVMAYFRDQDAVMGGSALFMLGALLFVCFAAELRAVLRHAEGAEGRIAPVAFAAGVATGTLVLLMHAGSFLGALYHEQLGPGAARSLFLFGDIFLYPAAMAGALFMAATAVVALRTRALPAWLAWPSLLVAVWLVIPPFGSPAGIDWSPPAWSALGALGAIPVWTVVTAIVLVVRSRREA